MLVATGSASATTSAPSTWLRSRMCSPPIIPLPITPYLMVSLMRRTVPRGPATTSGRTFRFERGRTHCTARVARPVGRGAAPPSRRSGHATVGVVHTDAAGLQPLHERQRDSKVANSWDVRKEPILGDRPAVVATNRPHVIEVELLAIRIGGDIGIAGDIGIGDGSLSTRQRQLATSPHFRRTRGYARGARVSRPTSQRTQTRCSPKIFR